MAENNENWIGSWFSAAKDKLKNSEVLESVYKDLGEFGGAVTKGASSVLSTTGNVLEKTLSLDSPDSTANTVKRSFSTFLDQMSTVLNPSPDDSDTEAIMVMGESEIVTLTKFQQLLHDLQICEETFTTEPSLSEQYKCWLEISEEQMSDGKLERYLQQSDVLRQQYQKFVPDKVDKDNFWKRYLFKKALIEDQLAAEESMKRKEIKENKIVEENVQWENGDFADDIELTEEQQIELLEEYERETKTKKQGLVKNKNSSNEGSPTHSPNGKVKGGTSSTNLDTVSSNSSIDDDWEKISG